MTKNEVQNREFLYSTAPVGKAVMTMAVPTVISQLISMIYNMADTFFVGRIGSPAQVAAVAVAAPASLVLTALANLFGIGGAGLFSRAVGEGNREKAERVSSFSFYAAFVIGILIALLVALFPAAVLRLLGADADTMPYAKVYILRVVALGAVPSLLSMVMSHFVRANGAAKLAGYVLSAGGILNLLLDPLFIFTLNRGIAGAAFATFLSNCFTLVVFCVYFLRRKDISGISFRPGRFSLKKEISLGVMGAGLPGMLQTLLASVSNMVLNNLASAFGSTAIAAFGVVKKLDQIPMSITIGFAQGIVPLVGYNFGNGNRRRMGQIIRCTMAVTVCISAVCVLIYELIPGTLIGAFLNNADTIRIGTPLLRAMCISTPLMAVAFVMITAFQASGRTKESTLLSVLRKGALDIPLMLLMGSLIPLQGLAFVQPLTEGIAMLTALYFFRRAFGKSKQ